MLHVLECILGLFSVILFILGIIDLLTVSNSDSVGALRGTGLVIASGVLVAVIALI